MEIGMCQRGNNPTKEQKTATNGPTIQLENPVPEVCFVLPLNKNVY